jgi:hypothetical protein
MIRMIRRWNRGLPSLCLLLAFTALLPGCRQKAEKPWLLQEGRCWQGKVCLGDPWKEAARLLGKATRQQEDKTRRYYDYDFGEIAVDTKTGEIASILLRQRWKTASGISMGDPVEKILSTYGGVPYRPPILSYPRRGVSFVLAPGQVTDPDGSKRPGWAAIWARIFPPQR